VIGLFTIRTPGSGRLARRLRHGCGRGQVPRLYFGWNFYAKYTFWSGVIGGAFSPRPATATDQLIDDAVAGVAQRRYAKMALVASGVLVFSSSHSF